MKTVGGLRKTRHRGRGLVEWFFVLTAAAYNLIESRRSGSNGMSTTGASKTMQNRSQTFDVAPITTRHFLIRLA